MAKRRVVHSRSAKPPPSAPGDPLAGKLVVRPKEAWDILCCGHSKGWALVKEGRLTVTKIGSMTLIHTSSIRKVLGLT